MRDAVEELDDLVNPMRKKRRRAPGKKAAAKNPAAKKSPAKKPAAKKTPATRSGNGAGRARRAKSKS
jgi:hypothetical protein